MKDLPSYLLTPPSVPNHIYPALLGVDNENDLNQLDEIQFIDTQTGNVLHKVIPRDEKI